MIFKHRVYGLLFEWKRWKFCQKSAGKELGLPLAVRQICIKNGRDLLLQDSLEIFAYEGLLSQNVKGGYNRIGKRRITSYLRWLLDISFW